MAGKGDEASSSSDDELTVEKIKKMSLHDLSKLGMLCYANKNVLVRSILSYISFCYKK